MKKLLLLLVLVINTTIAFSQSEEQNSNTHKRIKINNPTQEIISKLQDIGVDLRCGVIINEDEIKLELSQFELNLLNNKGIIYDVEIEDVSKFYQDRIKATYNKALIELEAEKAKTVAQRASISSTTLDNFLEYTGCNEIDWAVPTNFNLGTMGGCLTVSETLAELDQMRSLYPSLISAKTNASSSSQTTWGNPSSSTTNNSLTYTGQGTTRWDPQTIYYVRITGDQASAEGTKPQSLYTSMIHAREVGSLMSNIYFMWYLLENYATDAAVKNLVDNNELYFIPIVNPDGLRWNEHLNSSGGGMQRKNCRPNTGSTSNSTTLRGVDLNRNFDYFWGSAGSGSSGTASSDSYRGPTAFSEPETQILKEFVESREFKTCLMNHTSANSIPHPYGGNPTLVSGRENEMHKWHADMTRFNRYVSGATIFPAANGIADDWMVGGAADANGKIGSTKTVLASTPEHGGSGFWPPTTDIVPIAKRAMRISLTTAYYAGKYAKFHDLTQSDVSTLSSNLAFGIERLGQTASDFTLIVTPVSANIVSITSPVTQSGMTILEQRNITAALTLDASIAANDKIEYSVQLANGDGVVFYDANFEKYYQPTVLFSHNPDTDGLTGWAQTGGWNNSSVDAYSGSDALRTGDAVPYASNNTKTLTTTNSYDLSSSTEVLVQFYTKWDLERNYDFVELLGSTDGTNWQSLCGKYTKPEATSSTNGHDLKGSSASFQSSNSSGQIYDGDRMDNWVMEEIVINPSSNSFLLNATNAKFRFRFRSDSGNASENYSTTSDGFFIDDFKIISVQIACDATNSPTGISVATITATTANISWDLIPSATYDLRHREIGNPAWTNVTGIATTNYVLTGLTVSSDYEVQVNSRCTLTTSAFSSSLSFTTLAVSYCDSNSIDTSYEHIGNVTIGSINNSSSDGVTNTGYSDYTVSPTATQTTGIDINSSPSISITKTWTGLQYDESVYVWIDFNQDGDFDDAGETVLSTEANLTTPVLGNITVPIVALLGETRMRVSMGYFAPPPSCGSFAGGEVEDYTVTIFDSVLSIENEIELNTIRIYPNPVKEVLFINTPNTVTLLNYKITNTLGKTILRNEFSTGTNKIDVSLLNTGVYFLSLTTDKGNITKKVIIY